MPLTLQLEASPNNQFLVWDRLLGVWVGTWEGDILRASQVFTWLDGETERAAYITPEGECYQLCVDNHIHDGEAVNPQPIAAVVETAIDLGDQQSAATAQVELTLQHHHGAWAVFVEADGIAERRGPYQVAPAAHRFRTHGRGTYALSNRDDDQLDPARESYAVLVTEIEADDLGAAGILTDTGAALYSSSGKVLAAGSGEIGSDVHGVRISSERGLVLGARQTWAHTVPMSRPARSLLVRLETMRGWVALRRIAVRTGRKPFGRGGKA